LVVFKQKDEMASATDILAALEPHKPTLIESGAEQLATHFWTAELAGVSPELLPALVKARLESPQWAQFRRPPPPPVDPPAPPPGSVAAIAANYTQNQGLRGANTGGLTSASNPAPPHPSAAGRPNGESFDAYLTARVEHARGPSHGIVGPDGKPLSGLTGQRVDAPRITGRRRPR
jgi:hypothetical protein